MRDTSSEQTRYTVRTQYDTYKDQDITATAIKEIIVSFESDEDNFIVMEPSKLVGDCMYMQAIAGGDVTGLIVELRVARPNNGFSHYSTESLNQMEVIQLFTDFWLSQSVPDYSDWKDMTKQF